MIPATPRPSAWNCAVGGRGGTFRAELELAKRAAELSGSGSARIRKPLVANKHQRIGVYLRILGLLSSPRVTDAGHMCRSHRLAKADGGSSRFNRLGTLCGNDRSLRKAEDAEAPKSAAPNTCGSCRRSRMNGRSPEEQRRVRPDGRPPRPESRGARASAKATRLLILAGSLGRGTFTRMR
jgi:hypothetical protein